MHRPEGALPVAVIGWRLRGNQEDQLAAGARPLLGGGVARREAPYDKQRQGEGHQEPRGTHHGSPPVATLRSRTRTVARDEGTLSTSPSRCQAGYILEACR